MDHGKKVQSYEHFRGKQKKNVLALGLGQRLSNLITKILANE